MGYNSSLHGNGLGQTRMKVIHIEFPEQEIAQFCCVNHISRLSLFGSVLREDFRPDSDIDVLVEFEPDYVPGLIRLAGMEMDLSRLFGGRRVDMNTVECLSPYF